jgi:hypothetical protein
MDESQEYRRHAPMRLDVRLPRELIRIIGIRLAIAGLFAALALVAVMVLVPGFPP